MFATTVVKCALSSYKASKIICESKIQYLRTGHKVQGVGGGGAGKICLGGGGFLLTLSTKRG